VTLPLHAMVTDGEIIGEVVRRQGSRVHVLVGWQVMHFGRYGNQYRSIEYGYGNFGAELTVIDTPSYSAIETTLGY
jgi:hypothetical protein